MPAACRCSAAESQRDAQWLRGLFKTHSNERNFYKIWDNSHSHSRYSNVDYSSAPGN
jgi:hypothetical protein